MFLLLPIGIPEAASFVHFTHNKWFRKCYMNRLKVEKNRTFDVYLSSKPSNIVQMTFYKYSFKKLKKYILKIRYNDFHFVILYILNKNDFFVDYYTSKLGKPRIIIIVLKCI